MRAASCPAALVRGSHAPHRLSFYWLHTGSVDRGPGSGCMRCCTCRVGSVYCVAHSTAARVRCTAPVVRTRAPPEPRSRPLPGHHIGLLPAPPDVPFMLYPTNQLTPPRTFFLFPLRAAIHTHTTSPSSNACHPSPCWSLGHAILFFMCMAGACVCHWCIVGLGWGGTDFCGPFESVARIFLRCTFPAYIHTWHAANAYMYAYTE